MMTNTNTNTTTTTTTNEKREEREQKEFEEEERNNMRAAKRARAAIEHDNKKRADVVAALQRKFAPSVAEAGRAAAKAAHAAAEAARTLLALDAELREEEALLNGCATAEWPANGLGGHCVALAQRIEMRAAEAAYTAERVAEGAAAASASAADASASADA
jgi:hypothetical protein